MSFDAQTTRRELKRLMHDNIELDPRQLEREYVNYDMNRLISFFKLGNLDDTAPKWWVLLNVFSYGCAYLHKYDGPYTDKYDRNKYYLCPGGLGGEPSPQYRPSRWVGANGPMNWNYDYDIENDPDGCFIACDSLLLGVLPILRKWARMRAAVDVSIYMGTINTRLQTVFEAPDDNVYEAVKQLFDDIEQGKLYSVIENRRGALLKSGMAALPYGSAQGANMLRENVEVRQYLEGLHWADLGVSAPFNMKREAINSSEAGLADEMTRTYMDDVLYNLKTSCEKIGVTVEYEGALKAIEANTAELEEAIENPGEEERTDETPEENPGSDERVQE